MGKSGHPWSRPISNAEGVGLVVVEREYCAKFFKSPLVPISVLFWIFG